MMRLKGAWVRVQRHPLSGQPLPWLVYCAVCSGARNIFETLAGPPLGGAPDWRTAQDFADRHVREHEATRCHTCLHVPAVPLRVEAAR